MSSQTKTEGNTTAHDSDQSIRYTPTQVAQALGCTPDAVRWMVRAGRIPAVQMGGKIVILEQGFIRTIERALAFPDALAEQRADEADRQELVRTTRTRFESDDEYRGPARHT